VLYLNGSAFRTEHIRKLRTIFGTEKIGYSTILSNIKTYRVVVRTGVTGVHFKDHDSTPIPYPNDVEFDEYFSAWKQYNSTHVVSKTDDYESIPKVNVDPLITPEELEYCRHVDIRLPKRLSRMKTHQLEKEINKKRKEIISEVGQGELKAAPKAKRQKKGVPTFDDKRSLLENYFKIHATNNKCVNK
jgi:hypothetical protein